MVVESSYYVLSSLMYCSVSAVDVSALLGMQSLPVMLKSTSNASKLPQAKSKEELTVTPSLQPFFHGRMPASMEYSQANRRYALSIQALFH